MVDWVQDGEQLAGFVAVTQRGEGQDRPYGAVGVLAAVLSDARQIPLDVPRIHVGMVEWRGEQQDEPVTATNEVLLHRGHRPLGARQIRRPRQHAPRLGNRVYPALDVTCGAERSAVVEESSAVPVAVPTVALERPPERLHVASPPGRARKLAARLGDASKGGQNGVQEPSQPDALPPALIADSVHAVVPVARTDKRQAVYANRQAPVEGRHAVVEQRSRLA